MRYEYIDIDYDVNNFFLINMLSADLQLFRINGYLFILSRIRKKLYRLLHESSQCGLLGLFVVAHTKIKLCIASLIRSEPHEIMCWTAGQLALFASVNTIAVPEVMYE